MAALFFGGQGSEWQAWKSVLPLLFGMSLLSSAGYLWNDLLNVDEDRHHPRKMRRPIASGRMSVLEAGALGGIVLILGFGILWKFYGPGKVFAMGVMYVFITSSYSLLLRRLPLLDVAFLSSGFVVRVAAGAFALELIPTWWLIMCTYSLALLLGFGKRKGELLLLQKGGVDPEKTRHSLGGYTVMLLDVIIGFCVLLSVFGYLGFAMFRREPWIIVSVVPVAIGMLHYLRLAWRSNWIEVPERLLIRSPVLLVSVLVWLTCVVIAGLN